MQLLSKSLSYLLKVNSDFTIQQSKAGFNELIGYNPEGFSLKNILSSPNRDMASIHGFGSDTDSAEFIADFKKVDGNIISFKALIIRINEEDEYLLHLRNYTNMKLMRKDVIRKTIAIEHLTKSRMIRDGRLEHALNEILLTAARSLRVSRTNAWLYDGEKTEIQCIGSYDSRIEGPQTLQALPKIAFPSYFSLLDQAKIIVSNDAQNDPKISELNESYLMPLNIHAIMDIPIRIEGTIIGVLCVENTEETKEWSLQEQLFGLVIAQIISLAIETKNKHEANKSLQLFNKEQTVLLQEVHHRVKNNLSIVSSLLNMQANKCKDEYHRSLFNDSKNRINSIASVHEVIYKSNSFANLNLKDYIEEMLSYIQQSFSANSAIQINIDLENIIVDVTRAIPIALIINEIVTNCYKHAFPNNAYGVITVSLKNVDGTISLMIKDNGIGIQINTDNSSDSIGFEILEGLVDQIDGKYSFSVNNGTTFMLQFAS